MEYQPESWNLTSGAQFLQSLCKGKQKSHTENQRVKSDRLGKLEWPNDFFDSYKKEGFPAKRC